MKVLYSCLSRSWGGMEMFTITAAKQLISKGFDVDILCYPNSMIDKNASAEGLNVLTSKSSGSFHPINIYQLALTIKSNGYDLIHTQASKDLWLIVPALFLAGSTIPLYLTKQMGSYIIKKDVFHKILYKRLTYVFAISKVIEKNLLETCPVSTSQVRLLHNAIDTSKFNPENFGYDDFRNELNLDNDELLIGMLARFSKGKGHEEFLEAAALVSKKHKNLKFVIVGEPSFGEKEYGDKIKNLCTQLELNDIVTFTGFRTDTAKILAGMDIFVFPSHNEAFGIALAEALSMGLPSVCADKDGVLDIALDGVTSYLFKNKNSQDLSEKLELLIADPVKRKDFGKAARKRAIEHFDLDLLTNKVIEYYEESKSK